MLPTIRPEAVPKTKDVIQELGLNSAARERKTSFDSVAASKPAVDAPQVADYAPQVKALLEAHKTLLGGPALVEELMTNFPDCPRAVSSWVDAICSSEAALRSFYRGGVE